MGAMRRIVGMAALGVASIASSPPAADAAPPVVTVTPTHGPEGTPFTVAVACPTEPSIGATGEFDDTGGGLTTVEGPPGTGTGSGRAFPSDALFSVPCAGESTSAEFDADVPRIFFGPIVIPPIGVLAKP